MDGCDGGEVILKYFHYLKILIVILCLASCISNITEIDNKASNDSLEKLADKFFFSNDFDSALLLYQTIVQQTNSYDVCNARSLIKIGSIHFSKDNINLAIKCLNSGLCIYNNIGDSISEEDFDYLYSGTILIANCYRILGEYQLALEYYDDVELSIKQNHNNKSLDQTHELLSEIYSWKALVYFDGGLINKSITYNLMAIDIIEKSGYSDCLIYNNYSDLGRIFMREGDILKSEQYYNQAKRIVVTCFGNDSKQYAELMSEIGLLYLELEKYNDAVDYFNMARNISQTIQTNSEVDLAHTFNNLGDAFCGLNQFKKAISYYLKAVDLFIKNKSPQDAAVVYHNLGIAYYNKDSLDEAKSYYHKSLNVSNNEILRQSIYTSYTYQRLGQLYIAKKEYLNAINNYDKAISIIQQVAKDSLADNLPITELNSLSKIELLSSLYYKGYSEFQYYNRSRNIQYLHNSINSFQKAIIVSDILRQYYNFFKAKLSLNEIYIPLLNNYIKAISELHKIYPTERNENRILKAIGRTQYTVLRSLVKTTSIGDYIPVTQREQNCLDSLLRSIIFYEEKLFNVTDRDKSDELILTAEKQLFNTTFSLDTLLFKLGEKHPGFQNQMYRLSSYDILDVQSLLPDSTSIIQYYIYEDNIIIVAIKNRDHIIVNAKCDSSYIYDQKERLIQSITFSNTKGFSAAGSFFYDLLISPIESFIFDCNSLIIIPGLVFSGIPFEVLSKGDRSCLNSANRRIQYLISKYQISYQFSLNLWCDKASSKRKPYPLYNYDFVGFAPFFNGTTRIPKLSHSDIEIDNISKVFKRSGKTAKTFYGSGVTEGAILSGLTNSRIVHIASHGIQNLEETDYYISLNRIDSISSFSRSDNGMLYSSEIYTTPVKSELVTLSVCSSGNGKEETGEGKISFAYSLYFAGAHNILYTLWGVSDFHSQVFMSTFYTYVNAGLDYSEALQKTKLEFLYSKYSLPYFWSGYIINN